MNEDRVGIIVRFKELANNLDLDASIAKTTASQRQMPQNKRFYEGQAVAYGDASRQILKALGLRKEK
jgi:hypothetical protein